MREDDKILNDYLDALKGYESAYTVARIKEACMVTNATIYNWRHGRTKISAIYKKTINEVVGFNLYELSN